MLAASQAKQGQLTWVAEWHPGQADTPKVDALAKAYKAKTGKDFNWNDGDSQMGKAAKAVASPFMDVLGPLYMELGSRGARAQLGQYFTPWPIAEMMATISARRVHFSQR